MIDCEIRLSRRADFDPNRARRVKPVNLYMRSVNTHTCQAFYGISAGFVGTYATRYDASVSEHGGPVGKVCGRAAEPFASRQQVP